MTRDDVIRWAREAGFEVHPRKQEARVGVDALMGLDSTPKLERFAAMVAAAEREAILAIVRRHFREFRDIAGDDLEQVIRARKDQP